MARCLASAADHGLQHTAARRPTALRLPRARVTSTRRCPAIRAAAYGTVCPLRVARDVETDRADAGCGPAHCGRRSCVCFGLAEPAAGSNATNRRCWRRLRLATWSGRCGGSSAPVERLSRARRPPVGKRVGKRPKRALRIGPTAHIPLFSRTRERCVRARNACVCPSLRRPAGAREVATRTGSGLPM